VIGPWNYPITLLVHPLIGAIAAGNACVLKPSEIAPETSKAFAKLIPKYLDTSAIAVVEGGVPETTQLLKQKFDLIFYTGNGTVGKIIMKAASEYLTPVVLELGGKSPCIVESDANLEVTAKRILWGKFLNCGQTCIAPDYVLVNKEVETKFIDTLTKNLKAFYGDNPQKSPDYSRMINERHCARVAKLIEDGKSKGQIIAGGIVDVKEKYIAPTILKNVSKDNPLMDDEIFGPVLPILSVNNMDEAINYINSRPKPLALYLFTPNKDKQSQVIQRTTSGGVCINDCLMHNANTELPFGGVGESGIGAYHGKWSFDCFSHHRGVLSRGYAMDNAIRYPPYSDAKLNKLKKIRALKISKNTLYLVGALLVLGLAVWAQTTASGQTVASAVKLAAVGFLRTILGFLER